MWTGFIFHNTALFFSLFLGGGEGGGKRGGWFEGLIEALFFLKKKIEKTIFFHLGDGNQGWERDWIKLSLKSK